MSNKLRALGSASSGRKEENMFKAFAYLNTKGDFNPILLKQRVGMSDKTIESYLKQLQDAQMLTVEYQERLAKPFAEQWYAKMAGVQLKHAQKQYELWEGRLNKLKAKNESDKQALYQFVFSGNAYISQEELYHRLELALLTFSFMNAPKKEKVN